VPIIGNEINGVIVKFAPAVSREVDPRLIEGLRRTIRSDIAEGQVLEEIYLSPVNDQHAQDGGKTIDISRINGLKMSVYYTSNKLVKGIVDAMQTAFERYPQRVENFGPSFKKKLGASMLDGGYRDHVHLSVS
jgi:hypothetical protein